MAYKLNGCDTGGLPVHLIKPILDKYNVPFLVETGTASGDSAVVATTLFKRIWTIELIEGRVDYRTGNGGIHYMTGDSSQILPEVIKTLQQLKGERPLTEEKQWVVFYLDAHYSDDVPNETGYPECPLIAEINAVAEYGYESIIIIDDARLFFGQPPHPHNPEEWPSLKEIFLLLNEKFPYHHITITDDYILAIPLHVRDVIDEEWRDRFHIRYPNENDKLRGQVKDVYNAFMDKVYKPFLDYVK